MFLLIDKKKPPLKKTPITLPPPLKKISRNKLLAYIIHSGERNYVFIYLQLLHLMYKNIAISVYQCHWR